jgi:beta-galactosidase
MIYNLPEDTVFQENLNYSNTNGQGPAWYTSDFVLENAGDAYLDMRGWGKGMVWINGYNLGRYWKVGPTHTMYVPGCWLKKGANIIIIFDVESHEKPKIKGISEPIFEIVSDASLLHRK